MANIYGRYLSKKYTRRQALAVRNEYQSVSGDEIERASEVAKLGIPLLDVMILAWPVDDKCLERVNKQIMGVKAVEKKKLALRAIDNVSTMNTTDKLAILTSAKRISEAYGTNDLDEAIRMAEEELV